LVHPEQMSVLWTREVGRIMLCASIVMTILGGLIIRKIVRIQV
jgi:Flp pilus assembly protein TadB